MLPGLRHREFCNFLAISGPCRCRQKGTDMSDTTSLRPKAALGVGSIVGESFSILMRHFVKVMILAVIPTLMGYVLTGVFLGWSIVTGIPGPDMAGSSFGLRTAGSAIIQMVTSALATALLVQLAYDAKLQRPLTLPRYFAPALRALLPVTVLSIVAAIIFVLGFLALVVPGLWVYAVFSVMPAAVVIEKVGYGGLGRSAALTKEYRWPILGALFLIGIVNYVIVIAAAFLSRVVFFSALDSGLLPGVALLTILTSIGVALGSITVALIYARLREIKEGASVADIVAVFD